MGIALEPFRIALVWIMRLVDREVEEEGSVLIPPQEADALLDHQVRITITLGRGGAAAGTVDPEAASRPARIKEFRIDFAGRGHYRFSATPACGKSKSRGPPNR